MKKGFRRILTALLCLTLLLSTAAVSLTASAAGGSMTATVWEDFSGYEVGTKVKLKQIECTEDEGFVQTVNTLGAIGGVNAMQFGYTSLRG